ncbi:unnamed protein product [Peronospora destructor]|uniref:Nascent polypeptide-associated complex subunit alpha-like UBA domain-containing protein n=1 Tax=Peronospora destructor TaxID=86335 RepID=A0AAV0TMG0_9STRA|nr:unnamed protein product [Peronospora destructor]
MSMSEIDKTKQTVADAYARSDDEEPTLQQAKREKDESSAMEKLTDLVEEKQMDENKMKEAFLALRKQEDADKEAERLLAKKLAAVTISKDDVALVAQEMEISTQQADRKLCEAGGDVVKCLQTLLVV